MDSNHLIAKIGQYALISNTKNELLVLERARSKTWSLPGGRLNKGEKWDKAFIREIKEETNLEAKKLKPYAVNIITDPYQIKYCVYFEVIVADVSRIKISHEHSAYRWIDIKQAQKIQLEDNKIKDVVLDYFQSGRK